MLYIRIACTQHVLQNEIHILFLDILLYNRAFYSQLLKLYTRTSSDCGTSGGIHFVFYKLNID
jgi:hypothetical protein